MSGMFKKQKKLKFILLGPKDSGKTTILYKQQLHKTVDTMPTADFYTEDLNVCSLPPSRFFDVSIFFLI